MSTMEAAAIDDATVHASGNGTLKSESFVLLLLRGVHQSSSSYIAIASLLILFFLLSRVPAKVDPREPPVIHPRIPLIGHIVGMIRYQGQYFTNLYARRNVPIATLPMLNGKMYLIFEPSLVHSAFRSKGLSFLPFAVEFAQRQSGVSDEAFAPIRNTNLVPDFFSRIHPAMQNPYLHSMNTNALKYVSKELDALGSSGPWQEIPNLYLWLRDLMTIATTEALYGSENPFTKDQSLVDDLWIFEKGLSLLLLNFAPSIIAAKVIRSRNRVQDALDQYYLAKNDLNEDAAQLTRARAAAFRDHGIPEGDVGKHEIALLHVSTTNTIPTLFWFTSLIMSRPELVTRLRQEVIAVVQRGEAGMMTVNITAVEEQCPLLVACYREATRVSNRAMGSRRVVEDTTISDDKGNSYLLKKGVDVQMALGVMHRLGSVWGPDPATFSPDRFLVQQTRESAEGEKAKRAAYAPFGGGKHLCPGRNFAFAENMCFMIALLLAYDVFPLEGEAAPWKLPEMNPHIIIEGVAKPVNGGKGFGVRIRRRKGWEDSKWVFE